MNWHIAAPFNPKQYIILVNKLEKEQPAHDMQKVTDEFTAILRKNFERITSTLNFMPLRKTTYEIYPDQKSLLATFSQLDDESHTITASIGESEQIRIVSLEAIRQGTVHLQGQRNLIGAQCGT